MKRLLRLVASLTLIICILTNMTITSFADTNNDSSVSAFPYDNASNYVADCINKGIINMEGIATGTPSISLAILHKYTYQNLAEALIDDPLLTFNNTFWKNIRVTLDADFAKLVNWQKDMYIVLIMDYLNYSEKDDVYESNLEKKTLEFSWEIFKNAFGYANSEYLKNVDDLIENQSLIDAINFSNEYGYINEIDKYTTLVDNIKNKSDSALEYYENISKALAIKSTDESRLKFLEQIKEAGSDNKYFVEAVEEVMNAYRATFSEIAFSEGYKTMSGFAVKKCFNNLKDKNSELALIFEGLNTYTSGLDWLFNSDDRSDNNLKLLLLYTMGSYTLTALNSLRDTYISNPVKENAEALIGGFLAFLKYREYATSNAYRFISSTLFDGISNKIKNIFLNENQATYENLKKYMDYDIKFSQRLEELVNKYYSIYFNIVNLNDEISDNSTSGNSSDSQENATEMGGKFNEFDVPDEAIEFGGHYYMLFDKGLTWKEAKEAAESQNGHLVTITSQKEQDFISNLIKDTEKDKYWLGLSDEQEEGRWEWVTGEAYSYSNWAKNEPNNGYGTEDYVALASHDTIYDYEVLLGEWNDHNLDRDAESFGYICEWDEYQSNYDEQVQEPIKTTSDERDIVLVLDTSGSMSGTPMEETKKAATNFVKTILEEDASIGVVNYEDSAQQLSDFSIDKNHLAEVVTNISGGGGTNIESGLAEAKSMLSSCNAKKKIIVLMSDGEPNTGKEGDELIAYADEIKNNDVLIYTLGFFENMGKSKSSAQYLMEQLASNGCHYEVASADDLVFFFEDMADQINGQKYVYIRIACPVDVSVTYNGKTLCSAENDLNVRTEFGTLTFEDNENVTDTNEDDRIKVLRLKEGADYDVQIVGTGRGMMDYTIGFMDENSDYSDFRRFENVKITKHTVIDTIATVSNESVLNIDEDGDGKYDLKLRAEENGYGKEIKISAWFCVSICCVVGLLIVVALIVMKIHKRKKKGMVKS